MFSSLTNHCGSSRIYFLSGGAEFTNSTCEKLYNIQMYYNQIQVWVVVSAAISKIIIGLIMLKFMKERLYYPFGDVKKSVIFTLIASVVVISFNYTINDLNEFWEDIWTLAIVPVEDISTF